MHDCAGLGARLLVILNDSCGITYHYGIIGHVFRNDSTCTYRNIITYVYIADDNGMRVYGYVVAYGGPETVLLAYGDALQAGKVAPYPISIDYR